MNYTLIHTDNFLEIYVVCFYYDHYPAVIMIYL